MAIQDDILLPITQNKNKVPFDFQRKEKIDKELSGIKIVYSDKESDKDLKSLFKERFEALTGSFFEFSSKEELAELLTKLPENNPVFFSYNKEISNLIKSSNLPVTENITNSNITVTYCDYLIARTGTIMVSSFSVIGRRVISYPDIHVIVAAKDQLVFDLSDAVEDFYSTHKNNFPSFVSFITGPSKTADIEKTLILGAHGPKKIYLFLSNDKII